MKISQLKELVKEVLQELNELSATGTGATFSPGKGAQYATPYAFSKKGRKNCVSIICSGKLLAIIVLQKKTSILCYNFVLQFSF